MTWTEWREAALAGAAAVAEVNPFILVAVEGVGNNSDNGGWSAFWRENLTEAYANPLVAPPASRLLGYAVYLPLVANAGSASR